MKNLKTNESKLKFTIYRNKLKTLLVKAENDFYAKRLHECHGDSKRTWKIISKLVNKSNRDHSASSREFIYNNSKLTEKAVIVEKFNDYFVNIG